MAVTPELLQAMTDAIVDEVHPEQVILFGSHARGDARPDSDVDLLVVMPNGELPPRRDLVARLYLRLMNAGVPKDIVLFRRDEVDAHRLERNHLVPGALSEGRVLYEQ